MAGTLTLALMPITEMGLIVNKNLNDAANVFR